MAGRKEAGVARVAARGYWRATEARVVVEAWKRSGEALREFARRYGIHPRRLRRWAGQLEGEAKAVHFHPVRLVEGADDGDRGGGVPLEIEVGEGCTVRVLPGFAAQDLERVLEVLGVGAGC